MTPRAMHIGAMAAVMRAVVRCMVLAAGRRAFAGETRARAGKRDRPPEWRREGEERRSPDTSRAQPFIRLMSSTAIEPRLR